jgi:hypothetical protein
VAERVPPSAVLLERIDAERCRLRGGANTVAMMTAWLVMLDVDFVVEAPAELIEHLGVLHARLGWALGLGAAAARSGAKGRWRRRG